MFQNEELNMDQATLAFDAINEMNSATLLSFICTAIETAAMKTKLPASEIVEMIRGLTDSVISDLGGMYWEAGQYAEN